MIIDIREQYPLLPLEETLAIAEELGIRHPTDPRTKHPTVLTTDFLLTIKENNLPTTYEPRTAKYLADLLCSRTREKLEIERRYWKRRNKKLGIVTEQNLPLELIQNVTWVHPYFRLIDLYPLSPQAVHDIKAVLTQKALIGTTSLRTLTRACDLQLSLKRGTSTAVVRHMIANKLWDVDMYTPISLGEPLVLLNMHKGTLCLKRMAA